MWDISTRILMKRYLQGKVIVKYQDSDGQSIATDEIFICVVGTSYTAEQKEINGYTFQNVIGNSTAIIKESEQVVVFVNEENLSSIALVVESSYEDIWTQKPDGSYERVTPTGYVLASDHSVKVPSFIRFMENRDLHHPRF